MSDDSKIKQAEVALSSRWEKVQFHARGGNSWVFQVSDQNRSRAIKVLRRHESPRYERFKEEVIAAKELTGIAKVVLPESWNLPEAPDCLFKVGCSLESLAYLIMPFYAKGTTHAKYLSGRPVQDGGVQAVDAVLDVARTVKAIHEKKRAHRDLKPDNILIGDDDSHLLSDFGLCIDLSKGTGERTTPTEEIVGALWYRAPEYLRGRLDESDHRRGDIFSLGRVLWAFLKGADPVGVTDWEFTRRPIHEEVKGLNDGAFLAEIVQSATSLDPDARITAQELIASLEEWKNNIASARGTPGNLRVMVANHPKVIQERKKRERETAMQNALHEIVNFVDRCLRESSLAATTAALGAGKYDFSSGGGELIDGIAYQIAEPETVQKLRFMADDAKDVLPDFEVGLRIGYTTRSKEALNYEVLAVVRPPGAARAIKHFGTGISPQVDASVLADIRSRLREASEWVHGYLKTL